MGAIFAIDINMTLDMYVTASADGNIVLRCLRTSQVWKFIPVDRLSQPNIEVLSLKLSLHGYIFLCLKNNFRHHFYVFSINGDQLYYSPRENDVYELKYVQLTQRED